MSAGGNPGPYHPETAQSALLAQENTRIDPLPVPRIGEILFFNGIYFLYCTFKRSNVISFLARIMEFILESPFPRFSFIRAAIELVNTGMATFRYRICRLLPDKGFMGLGNKLATRLDSTNEIALQTKERKSIAKL